MALQRQISDLLQQDLRNVREIIVLDNASTYDVESVVKKYRSSKIRIIKNNVNLGMGINLVRPFLKADPGWLWLLSDDDKIDRRAVSKITTKIAKADPKTAMIKFGRENVYNKAGSVSSLEGFVNYYHSESPIRRGDVVFMSTTLLNTEVLSEFVQYALEYNYSLIGFLAPVFIALNKGDVVVEFVPDSLVGYGRPQGDNWNIFLGAQKISTISHMQIDLDNVMIRKFYNIVMPLTWRALILELSKDFHKKDKIFVLNTYFYIYRLYIPLWEKFLFFIIYRMIDYKVVRRFILRFYG